MIASQNIPWTKIMRMTGLDGLRGFAVLGVLLVHTLTIPESGHLGVNIFFTLSGFLISSQLYDELNRTGTIDFGRFYWKRCVRLIPAFLAVVAFYYALCWCFPTAVAADDILRVITLPLVANIYYATGHGTVIYLSHTWTLAVEWQFYIVWPLLLALLFKAGVRGATLLSLLALAIVAVWICRWEGNIFMQFDGILIGAMVPLIQSNERLGKVFINHRVAQPVMVVAGVGILALVFHSPSYFNNQSQAAVSVLTAIAILCMGHARNNICELALDNKVLRYFGKISYGLYLYHFPIAAVLFVTGHKPVQMLITVLVAIPIADVSWRYLEEPLIKYLRRPARVTQPIVSGSEPRESGLTP